MIFGWIFDIEMGSPEKQKQAFRVIRVAKYEVSVFRENVSKMRGNMGSQHDSKIELGALNGQKSELLGGVLRS